MTIINAQKAWVTNSPKSVCFTSFLVSYTDFKDNLPLKEDLRLRNNVIFVLVFPPNFT